MMRKQAVMLLVLTAMLCGIPSVVVADVDPPATDPIYMFQAPTRGGTGKIYMGREISLVMGHLAADWLERFSRRHGTDSAKGLVEVLRRQPVEEEEDVVADHAVDRVIARLAVDLVRRVDAKDVADPAVPFQVHEHDCAGRGVSDPKQPILVPTQPVHAQSARGEGGHLRPDV